MSERNASTGGIVGLVDMSKVPGAKFVAAPANPAITGLEWETREDASRNRGKLVASVWQTTLRDMLSDGAMEAFMKAHGDGGYGMSHEWRRGGYPSIEEACKGLASGRPSKNVLKGAEEAHGPAVQALKGLRLEERFPSRKREPRFSTSGKFVLSRILANDPHWGIRHQRGKNLPVLRLAFSTTVSAVHSAKDERKAGWTGEIICCAAEEAERRLGVSVEIMGMYNVDACLSDSPYGGERPNVRVAVMFPVKRAGDRLDRQRILSLCTLASCRIASFAALDRIFGKDRHNGTIDLPTPCMNAALRLHGTIGRTVGGGSSVEDIATRATGLLTDALDAATGRNAEIGAKGGF